MSLPILRLSYNKIGEIAEDFLSRHHPQLTLPIPIEEIAEQKLRLKIEQRANLRRDFDVDGFLVSDLKTIFIDLDMYWNIENRAKFTIAHEIGHLILHEEIFRNLEINSVERLNQLATKITKEEYGWLEYQAYSFASQTLVPKKLLLSEIKNRIGKTPSMEAPEIFAPIAQDLLQVFQVSGEVLLRRLQKEGIVKSNS